MSTTQQNTTDTTADTTAGTTSTNLDTNNAKIAKVWNEKGVEEAVKQMFIDPNNGSRLSYAEMRMYYG
tara:strand:- start:1234 stop:1437 length:204 start_codon:yes stop_codon:yes gene_type:complete